MRIFGFKLNEYVNRSGAIKDRLIVLGGGDDEYVLTFYNDLVERLEAVLVLYHRAVFPIRSASLIFCGTSMLQRPNESVSDLASLGYLQIDREMSKSAGEALNKLKRHPMATGAKGFDPYWRIMKGLYEQYMTIMSENYMAVDLSVISVDERRSVSSRLDLGFLLSFLLL